MKRRAFPPNILIVFDGRVHTRLRGMKRMDGQKLNAYVSSVDIRQRRDFLESCWDLVIFLDLTPATLPPDWLETVKHMSKTFQFVSTLAYQCERYAERMVRSRL